MKVLFISAWYPNSVHPLKGIFVKKHAAAIQSAGHEIQVVAITVSPSQKTFERKVYKEIDEYGIITHHIELNSRFYKWIHLNLFFQYSAINKYIEKTLIPEFKPDIIHSNVLYPAGILGYKLATRYNLPHVITEHWSKVDKFMSGSLFSYIGKKAYNNAKAVTVVSEFLKNSLSKHFSNSSKIKVIPNVINTKSFKFKSKPETSALKFCCVAHWTNPKRPDLIYYSLNELSKTSNKEIILNVVGEGTLIENLKSSEWNFKINYLGNLPPEKLAGVLHDSNYFLHASEIETFSIVIAEALATGTPVLASNVGAIPELINSSNGIIVKNDLASWVNGLRILISKNDYDAKKISEACDKFSLACIGKEFYDLYNSIESP